MISANIAIQGPVALGLHRALCAIGGRCSSASSTPSKLRVGPFKPQQIFPWAFVSIDSFLLDSALRKIRAHKELEEGSPSLPTHCHSQDVQPRPSSFILSCPSCQAPREMSRTRLYHATSKPCIVVCRSCHKASSSRRWQCSCLQAKPWIACPTHRPLGFLCKPIFLHDTSMRQMNSSDAVH